MVTVFTCIHVLFLGFKIKRQFVLYWYCNSEHGVDSCGYVIVCAYILGFGSTANMNTFLFSVNYVRDGPFTVYVHCPV